MGIGTPRKSRSRDRTTGLLQWLPNRGLAICPMFQTGHVIAPTPAKGGAETCEKGAAKQCDKGPKSRLGGCLARPVCRLLGRRFVVHHRFGKLVIRCRNALLCIGLTQPGPSHDLPGQVKPGVR